MEVDEGCNAKATGRENPTSIAKTFLIEIASIERFTKGRQAEPYQARRPQRPSKLSGSGWSRGRAGRLG
jgi:hypothetical protein